jgi:hypothetical protein
MNTPPLKPVEGNGRHSGGCKKNQKVYIITKPNGEKTIRGSLRGKKWYETHEGWRYEEATESPKAIRFLNKKVGGPPSCPEPAVHLTDYDPAPMTEDNDWHPGKEWLG